MISPLISIVFLSVVATGSNLKLKNNLISGVNIVGAHVTSVPVEVNTISRRSISSAALKALAPIATTMYSFSQKATATDKLIMPPQLPTNVESTSFDNMPLGKLGYTDLAGIPMCRILNGMWQVSGAHGYDPQLGKSVTEMARCADSGFTTFDLADHYGPAGKWCTWLRT